ncbi:MAG: prepilin-type N-terminal cleavage/methylation domain-containing protein [Candidatus Omnitrophota bacterium]
MKKQNGFTLIEVLIVVVIIGVLAALVIPRFLTAPEKAIVAEANQMLGSLSRAQQVRLDMGLTFLAASPLVAANWQSLGLVVPSAASKFVYSCTSPTCSAARTVNGTASTATMSSTSNTWACTGAYAALTNGGCTVT